ncbi:MAG: hypothetical protein RI897_1759 [Verrucomicrobiota bacterium]
MLFEWDDELGWVDGLVGVGGGEVVGLDVEFTDEGFDGDTSAVVHGVGVGG